MTHNLQNTAKLMVDRMKDEMEALQVQKDELTGEIDELTGEIDKLQKKLDDQEAQKIRIMSYRQKLKN